MWWKSTRPKMHKAIPREHFWNRVASDGNDDRAFVRAVLICMLESDFGVCPPVKNVSEVISCRELLEEVDRRFRKPEGVTVAGVKII